MASTSAAMNLEKAVVVITGASRGIGVSIARSFAKAGATLCLIARTTADLESLAEELIREYNIRVDVFTADITNLPQISNVATDIESRHERVDVIINNAGIIQFSLVENVNVAEWWRVMEVNLLGPVALTQALLPRMLQQPGSHKGTIISIGSRMCGGSARYLSAYGCSKAALMQFHQCLNWEVSGRGINNFVVQPGNVETSILTPPLAVELKKAAEDAELARRVKVLRDTSTCDPNVTADLCVKLSSAPEAKSLSGRYIDAEQSMDEVWMDISAQGDGLIQKHGLYQLKIRKLADVE